MVNLNLSSVYTPDLFARSYLKSVAYGTNTDLNLITLLTELCIVNVAIMFGIYYAPLKKYGSLKSYKCRQLGSFLPLRKP